VQALRHDETPDYAALEEDIKKMLFDEAKFNKMFEEALPTFYRRLSAEVIKQSIQQETYNASKKFVTQRDAVMVFSKMKAKINARFQTKPF